MKKTGFTLVEVLVASIILVMLIGILAATVMGTRSIFEASDISVILQADARAAINKMDLDLRRTNKDQISIVQNDPISGCDAIVYHLPSDSDQDGIPDLDSGGNLIWDTNAITIRLDSGGTQRLQKEVQGGNIEILGSNVKKINFIDRNIDASLYFDEIKIILELEKTTSKGRTFSFDSTTIINMRN